MREFAVPPIVELADDHNATDDLWKNADDFPDSVLFAVPDGDGWRDVTAAQFREQVVAVARGLASAGINPGDRVGLMSRTRYEWTLFDYSIWAAGAVTVPIYDTSSAEQVKWILSDSGAVACVAELPRHIELVDAARASIPAVKQVWQIEDGAVDALVAAGEDSDVDVEERRSTRGREDLATIVYTSGTTGRPKGCELSHENLVADIANVLPHLDTTMFREDQSTLMFLPLAHVLARIVQVGCVQARVRVGHIADRTDLVAKLPGFRPTFLVAVPRVFEKVYNSAEQKAVDGGKSSIFYSAAQTAIDYSKSLDSGGPGLSLKVKHALFDKLVYSKLRAVLGGRCENSLSGGAPLSKRLAHFFRGVGVTIYEGYGLTETSPVVSLNVEGALRIGTVGKPIPGTAIRIADGGELQVKGKQVFQGYWNNKDATAQTFDADGWLKTGDIAEIDDDGFLKITGRIKEIIVTAGGKNVAPAPLEDVIRAHPLVGQCLVVGDARPFIGALVALDHEVLPAWLERTGRSADTPISELRDDPEVVADIQTAVDSANELVSKAEAIKSFRILPAALTEDTGEITPKQSVKRNVVLDKYAEDFEAIYKK
ncbi:MAG: AMP-dependent synthetase/ligase [Stackebrandtia sp.]